MSTSTDRLLKRSLKLARRRPPAPRDVRFDSSANLLYWTPPQSDRDFTHYRIRIGTDIGRPDYELSSGQTRLSLQGVERVAVSCYNANTGLEGVPTRLSGIVSSGGARDYEARLVFEFSEFDPIDVLADIAANHRRTRLEAGERFQPGSAVLQTKEQVDGDIVMDVLVSADGGATWATIFDADKPTAVDGFTTGPEVTTFTITELNPDDLLRYDVLTCGNNTVVSGELVIRGRVV
jgi:hypothetical protein